MPRPVLPSNNSKYWGADLNNYLLSLQSQLDQLQKIHSEDSSFDVTVFKEVGFARDYSLTITNEENWELNINDAFVSKSQEPGAGLQLSGTVYLQSATGDSITTRKIAVDLDIFSTDTDRKNGSISSSGQITLSESFNLSESFYNVYYYLDVADDDAKPVIIFSQDTLANLSMIMIGTLDHTSEKSIFIPRSFSNTKGITQSLKDCLEPRVSVIDDPFSNNTKPPFLGEHVIGEESHSCSYWMFINGIQPSLSNTGSIEPNTQSFDSKILYVDNTQIYIWNDSSITTANNNESFTASQYDFYLSISGKVFAQPHAENSQFTDYIVQSTEDLRFYNVFKAGGLVYIGTYYPDSSYPKFCIAQSGGVPPILNATHYDWNKVLIEEKEFYSDGTTDFYYKIDITPNNITAVNHTIHLKMPESASLMIPIFDSNHISTTTNSISFISGAGALEIAPLKLEVRDLRKFQTSELTYSGLDITSSVEGSYSSSLNSQRLLVSGPSNHVTEIKPNNIFVGTKYGYNGATSNDYLNITNNTIVYYASGAAAPTIQFVPGTIKGTILFNYSDIQVQATSKLLVQPTTGSAKTLLTFQDNPAIIVGDKIRIGGIPSDDLTDEFLTQIGENGEIRCVSTTYTSDRRYKTNIQPLSNFSCLKAVKDLNVYTYTYLDTPKDSLGMMAQDIEELLPDYAHLLVHTDNNGKKYVEEHKLLFILWQAVKELIAKQKD